MPTPTAVEITLTDEERSVLEAWTSRRKTAQALALRARIVLAAAGQLTNAEIAEREGVSRPTVTKWRNRFAAQRLEGLLDEPRPGRPRTITDRAGRAGGDHHAWSPRRRTRRTGRRGRWRARRDVHPMR